MLSVHEPVKNNLPTEKQMNVHGQEVPEVEKKVDYINSQIILLCSNANHAWTSEK